MEMLANIFTTKFTALKSIWRKEKKQKESLDTSSIDTTRLFGIEMEGYARRHPKRLKFDHAIIKSDGSLANSNWDVRKLFYGIEVVTLPIRNFNILRNMFIDMKSAKWFVDNRAGTHIHVNISDYTNYDKAKLLWFAKEIEKIMFMFVRDHRYGNGYCQSLNNRWSKVFKKVIQTKKTRVNGLLMETKSLGTIDFNSYVNVETALLANGIDRCSNDKYSWLNVLSSNYNTAEFRIFHATENIEHTIGYVKIAIGIVDLVKRLTHQELKSIIESFYSDSSNCLDVGRKFINALGVPLGDTFRVYGKTAMKQMDVFLKENKKEESQKQELDLVTA